MWRVIHAPHRCGLISYTVSCDSYSLSFLALEEARPFRGFQVNSKANIVVVFYSRDGSVEALAKAVSEGAREAGAEVRLRRASDIVPTAVMAKVPGWEERSKRMLSEYGVPTQADVEWADGVIFGTPTRFGNTSAELKAFIDSLGGLWFQGKLNGKAAGAFTSTAMAEMRRR